MPISSNACPTGAPEVTSLRPSRLATRVAGAAVALPGTVMPASRVTSLFADAALMPSVPNATPAAMAVPMLWATRPLVLLIMGDPSRFCGRRLMLGLPGLASVVLRGLEPLTFSLRRDMKTVAHTAWVRRAHHVQRFRGREQLLGGFVAGPQDEGESALPTPT